MSVNNIENTNNTNSHRNFRNKVLFPILIYSTLMGSCDLQSQKQTDIQSIDITEDTNLNKLKIKEVKTTPEYEMYKIDNLPSLKTFKQDFNSAQLKISNNSELHKILPQINLGELLPMAIKESMLDNSSESHSHAKGYFQLRKIALDEIQNKFKLTTQLDVNNPVDNIILGALYRKICLKSIRDGTKDCNLNYSDSEYEYLMIMSYNMGEQRVKRILKTSETKDFDSFIKYLVQNELSIPYAPNIKRDSTYGVEYIDYFGGKLPKNLSGKDFNYRKIVEGIRYFSVIKGISDQVNSNETVKVLGSLTIKDKSLYSQVLEMRKNNIFKKDANVNEICQIILETNGFFDTSIPENTKLTLYVGALENYINIKII